MVLNQPSAEADPVPEAPGHGASFFLGRKMTDCGSSSAFWQEIARFLRVQTESSGHADTSPPADKCPRLWCQVATKFPEKVAEKMFANTSAKVLR